MSIAAIELLHRSKRQAVIKNFSVATILPKPSRAAGDAVNSNSPSTDKYQTELGNTMKIHLLLAALLATSLPGCNPVVKKAPAIAHVHIGHVLTGWRKAPGKHGLLATAESEAAIVLEYALKARRLEVSGDLEGAQAAVAAMVNAVDPLEQPVGAGLGYGLRLATIDSISHLNFAGESDDASANVRSATNSINKRANEIVFKNDQIVLFAEAASAARSLEEFNSFIGEIITLAQQINDGSRADSAGYGLFDLRRDTEAMTQRERPPYVTVDTWYLFNLIRLPTGKWAFSSQPPADD